jgi:hypothetical protein
MDSSASKHGSIVHHEVASNDDAIAHSLVEIRRR